MVADHVGLQVHRDVTIVVAEVATTPGPIQSGGTIIVVSPPNFRKGYCMSHDGAKSMLTFRCRLFVPVLIRGLLSMVSLFMAVAHAIATVELQPAISELGPSVVEGVTISDRSENTLTISWTISADVNHATYTYNVTGTGPDFPSNQTVLNANSITVSNLKPGADYNITVYAVTETGISGLPSAVISGTTRPSVVGGVTITGRSENTLNISWTISADVNHATYTYNVNGTGPDFPSNITVRNANSITVSNLKPGADYNITVYAVTATGISGLPSAVIIGTTRPSAVLTFVVDSVSNNSVNLSWMVPNDINVTTYTYEVQVENFTHSYTVAGNHFEVKDLMAGETYYIIIYTVTSNGVRSSAFATLITTTMPNEPQNLDGTPVDVSKITITWKDPMDNNANLYNYKVEWVNAKDGVNGSNITIGTTFTIKDLFPGNQYTISVTSIFKDTTSNQAVIMRLTNPISTENFTVGNITNTTATLQWTQPQSTNSIVSGYIIEFCLKGSSDIKLQNISEKQTTFFVEHLQPGNQYEFTVKSFAASPQSRSLGSSANPTYSSPKTVYAETIPAAVLGPKCFKVDGYRVNVQFKCPQGNFSAIEILVDGTPTKAIQNCTGSAVMEVSGLQPAKSYGIQVKTVATQNSVSSESFDCSTDSTAVIVGSVLGVLLFLLLIGIVAFIVMKKRRSKEPEPMHIPQIRFHTIAKEKFRQHYKNKHADSDFGFAEEYQELSSVGTSQSKKAAELPENRAKNRFTNVLPYDHSRVKLSIIDGITSTDYINANYMPGYNSTKEFIASQGPLPNTTADFWRMIWEHHIDTIVMLTNCMENGRIKCERYWPLDYTPCTYGDIIVTGTSDTILEEWTIRDFSVKHGKQLGTKSLRHFHFTAWPDHGVPDSTASIIKFRNLVRDHMDQRRSTGPTLVHCSAGVGRTGTLIALDYLIQQMEREYRIGVYGFVNKMRLNRPLMVQTEAQYIFLNKCMLDLIEQPPEEPIYENQGGTELIYENAAVVRNFQKENHQL
ncbi:receptor-type tyrosine-protein phosphatase H [Gastrophryne carolinensis]